MTRSQLALVTSVSALSSLAGGFLAAALFMPRVARADGGDSSKIVEAKQFQVVDDQGKARGLFGMLPDGSVTVTFLDPSGAPRFVLASRQDGGTKLAFVDASGKMRLTQAVEPQTGVILSLHDQNGNERLSEAYHDDGTSALLLAGPDGKQYVSLIGGPDKPSTLLLNGPGNTAGAMMSVLGDGRAFLALMADGKPRLRAMTQADGAPSLQLINAKSEAFWTQEEKK